MIRLYKPLDKHRDDYAIVFYKGSYSTLYLLTSNTSIIYLAKVLKKGLEEPSLLAMDTNKFNQNYDFLLEADIYGSKNNPMFESSALIEELKK